MFMTKQTFLVQKNMEVAHTLCVSFFKSSLSLYFDANCLSPCLVLWCWLLPVLCRNLLETKTESQLQIKWRHLRPLAFLDKNALWLIVYLLQICLC